VRRTAALVLLASLFASPALADGPQDPPKPWFKISDVPSHDPDFAITRWLWSREDHALRYCRKPVDKEAWVCADVAMPDGTWTLQRLQDRPKAGVASSLRFYSPDKDRTLYCEARESGVFGCD
jgi:hypothetical protein